MIIENGRLLKEIANWIAIEYIVKVVAFICVRAMSLFDVVWKTFNNSNKGTYCRVLKGFYWLRTSVVEEEWCNSFEYLYVHTVNSIEYVIVGNPENKHECHIQFPMFSIELVCEDE